MPSKNFPTTNSFKNIANVFKEELILTKGPGRLLLLAMFANIPFIGFVPYLTQALTVIFLSIFLKKYRLGGNIPTQVLIIATIAFQLFWFPYISQLVTLVLLGLIYATATKYQDTSKTI